MPRTAVTLGKTHGGEWKLLSGPDVPIQEQLAKFRATRCERSHKEFSLIQFQEQPEGPALLVRLRTPEAQQEHDALRDAEMKKAKEAAEAEAKRDADARKAAEAERAKAHAEAIEETNKKILSDPNRKGGGRSTKQ